MPFGNMFLGFADAMAQDIMQRRQQQRQAEDENINYQMKIIEGLINRPNVNPNILNRAISDLAALQEAKAPGARKIKGSGWSGKTEMPVSQILQSIASGIMPMQGPTTEQVPRPVGEQIEMTRGAELQPFNPQSLPQIKSGGMDGMDTVVPPAPVGPPPMITPLQRAAQQAEFKQQLLPLERQPLLLSPDEIAEQEGQAAGVRAGAIRSAQKKADFDAWIEAGGSPEEFRKLQLTGMRGGAAQRTQYDDAGYYTVNGKTIRAVRREMPDGSFQTVDALSGLPIPPDAAEATFAPKAEGAERDMRSGPKKEYDDYVADETQRGTPANKILSFDAWQTHDAKRNPRGTNVSVLSQALPGAAINPRQASIINPLINNYRNSAPVKAVARTAPLEGAVQRIKADPNNAFTQLNIIYGFIQALDTYQSTVREGEISLTQQTMSSVERLKMGLQRAFTAKILSPQAAIGIASEAEKLIADIKSSAAQAAQTFRAQARINGLDSYWDQYMAEAYGQQPMQSGAGVPVPPAGPKKSLSGFVKGSGIQK